LCTFAVINYRESVTIKKTYVRNSMEADYIQGRKNGEDDVGEFFNT